jgi:hypothetical protein
MSKNPFLQSGKLKMIITQQSLKVIDSQEISSIKGSFVTQQKFEDDPFTKVYNSKQFNNVFKMTTDTACKMFIFIVYNLPKNQDLIILDSTEVMEFVGIKSLATYYKYIQELIDNAVIARKTHSEYWVNPFFIFNGNRLSFYEEHCPECIQEINIQEIAQQRQFRKQKELMQEYDCKSYYELKKKLGKETIKQLLLPKTK